MPTEAQLKSLNILTAKKGIKDAEAKLKNWQQVLNTYINAGEPQANINQVKDLINIEINNIKDLIEIIKLNGGKYIPKLNLDELTKSVSKEGMTALQKGEFLDTTANFFNRFKIPIFVIGGLLLLKMFKK